MKKIILFGLVGVLAGTSANAGWLDSLGFGKKKEPVTLEEACAKDEITKICPETVLGDKTMLECLTENASGLSDQCLSFVKKATVEKVESVKASAKEKVKDVKAKVQAAKSESKAKSEQAKADAKVKKDEAQATAKEISDSAKQTGKDLGDAGKNLKSMF